MTEQFTQDYIFVGEKGGVLDIDTFEPDAAAVHAQELARKHRTEVTYAIVVDYSIKPETCGNCGEILPLDSVCPCLEWETDPLLETIAELREGIEAL